MHARIHRFSGILARILAAAAAAASCAIAAGQAGSPARETPPSDAPEGEARWRIKYGNLVLGRIRFESRDSAEGRELHLEIVSDPRLPLIDLSTSFRTLLDRGSGRPLRCVVRSRRGGETKDEEYRYDYGSGTVLASVTTSKDRGIRRESALLPLAPRLLDGPSLIDWMMSLRGSGLERAASCLGGVRTIPLRLAFREKAETMEQKDGGPPCAAYRVEGEVLGRGIAGFSGRFTLWLSAEPSRVPLGASIKLWIGEAVIEAERPRPDPSSGEGS